MHARFRSPPCGHNPKFTASGKDIRRNTTSAFPSDRGNTYIAMTMKHPRTNERVDSPTLLLGSDHSKKKRQRTISDASENCAIEYNGRNSNVNTQDNSTASSSTNTSTTYSPRMMALLSSLEALDDKEHRQFHPQSTANPSQHAPASTPYNISSSTNQVAATLLLQKQRYPRMAQPLNARPAIHKIEEHPPTSASTSQVNKNSLPSAIVPNVRSRDPLNKPPAMDTSALDTIQRAVAAAAAAAAASSDMSSSEDPTHSSTLEHHRRAGATARAAVAATSGGAFTHASSIASKTNSLPLIPYGFSNNASTTTSTKYDAAHWNHGTRPLSIQEPTSRQLAIHNAVHSDYKKIYKPLQRPPRLPTPHEALVVAVISTPTPATSTCR